MPMSQEEFDRLYLEAEPRKATITDGGMDDLLDVAAVLENKLALVKEKIAKRAALGEAGEG